MWPPPNVARRALSSAWLLAAISPTMEWFALWRKMSNWDKQMWEMQNQRGKVLTTHLSPRNRLSETTFILELLTYTIYGFLLASLIWVSVTTIESILNEYSIHVHLFVFYEREKLAPEPHIRGMVKSICLNIRTRFRTRGNSNKGLKRHLKQIFKSPKNSV